MFSERSASMVRSALQTGSTSPPTALFDAVEFLDLGIGVEQQVAQGFVLSAELETQRGEKLLVELERIFVLPAGVAGVVPGAGVLRPSSPPNFFISGIPMEETPIRPAEATPNHPEKHCQPTLNRDGKRVVDGCHGPAETSL